MTGRREFLKMSGLAAGALALSPSIRAWAAEASQAVATHAIGVLPPLGYAPDSLEPFIDAQTMSIHHDKHHKAYVDNLVKAIGDDPKLSAMPVEALVANLQVVPEDKRTAVRNQGGGHANHSLFWPSLAKNNGALPKGDLAAAIDKSFGSFAGFQTAFTKAALAQFGSGWAFLAMKRGGEVGVAQMANQDSPLGLGMFPIMGIDVWEHAYYLKYQNRRPEYVQAFYNVINWDFAQERYAALKKV
ncbi:superoxide dismutase [Terriglobus aquaticus]|uniref:Superoxide dismutase n=1 Tax=Terriglobus aquaticus TaxID=940139 RepID=A0ABW9KKE9_9BACT|nr:superoxide dismutase [Terriglobus aquaticus]